MSMNALSRTDGIGANAIAPTNKGGTNLSVSSLYSGVLFAADVLGASQSAQPKTYLGRSSSTQVASAPNAAVQSTSGIVLRGRYAKADSLSWPFWDNSDTFRVILPQSGNFNVGITGFSKNVDLQLFTLTGRLIASSSLPGTTPDSITLKSLAAGVYIVKVNLKVLFSDVTARTNYKIFMSRSEPSDILAEEANLGRLGNSVINRSGIVNSSDTSDIYRFSLAAPSALNLNLNGLRSNANIRMIRDSNRNGLIDTNEIVASSTQSGANPESIDMRWLASGDQPF